MSFTPIGIISISITLISIVLICVGHFLFKKYNNKIYSTITNSYYFWMVIGILFLVYFISARYVWNMIDYFNIDEAINRVDPTLGNNNETWRKSYFISRVFLLDLCPFLTLAISLFLIVDKTRMFAKSISIFGLIGGTLAILFGVGFDMLSPNSNIFKYIFLGDGENRMYFMIHYLLIVICLLLLLNTKTFTKYSFFGGLSIIAIFLIYASIVAKVLNITNNVSGAVKGDYYPLTGNPETFKPLYGFIPNVLKIEDNFELCITIFYSFVICIYSLGCLMKNLLTFDQKNRMQNNLPWYHDINGLNRYLYQFDSLIDFNNLNKFKSKKKNEF